MASVVETNEEKPPSQTALEDVHQDSLIFFEPLKLLLDEHRVILPNLSNPYHSHTYGDRNSMEMALARRPRITGILSELLEKSDPEERQETIRCGRGYFRAELVACLECMPEDVLIVNHEEVRRVLCAVHGSEMCDAVLQEAFGNEAKTL